MQDLASKILGLLVILVVAGSIAFGAATAVAMGASADECLDDGYNFFGECVTQNYCDYQCRLVLGEYGECDQDNCCICVH
jgi:hypothetical protein